MNEKPEPIANRRDFVLLFDVRDGNPNGDPDAGNMPRIDPDTSEGLVTDVALKRKVRNYVQMMHGNNSPFRIFIREGAVLNLQLREANERIKRERKQKKKAAAGEQAQDKSSPEKAESKDGDSAEDGKPSQEDRKKYMCEHCYDIRAFGAVMNTGSDSEKSGQVRGPVQMTFARSVAPVVWSEHRIGRIVVTKKEDAHKAQTFGNKYTIPYGLYCAHGFVSAHFAAQTGFSESDLALFWEALENMFEHDRSAARGEMTTRGLFVFKHCGENERESMLGCAPAHRLLDLIRVKRVKPESETPRAFDDFSIPSVDEIKTKLEEFGGKIELEKPKSG